MKRLTLILLILCAAISSAQTKTDSTQIAVPAVAAPSVVVVLPNGGVAVLRLEGFTVDVTNDVPTLRPVVATPPSAVKITHEKLTVTTQNTSPIPAGCGLVMVIRNIPQHLGVDYDVAGSTITWRAWSAPKPTDQISAICQR